MIMPVVQIRLMGVLVDYRVVCMKMTMPFAFRNQFIVQVVMMAVVVAVKMDVFHGMVSMHMVVRKQIGGNDSNG